MNVIPNKSFFPNNVFLYPFLKIIFTMLITGFLSGLIVRTLFFWAPRGIRNYLIQVASGLGVLYGLYLAFVVFKLD